MWSVIYAWPWQTIWAAVSAVFSMVATAIAVWALLRWRKQDELKAKFAFKQAVGDYAYQLTQLPPRLFMQDMGKYSAQCQKLTDLLAACNYAWLMTEGLINNKMVISYWEILWNNHQGYLVGRIQSDDLGAACMGILTEKFVFK